MKSFFIDLGLRLEGQTTVEGPEIGKLIGLENVRATLAMLRTPDGQGIELDKFHVPQAVRFGPAPPEHVPVNALGYRRVMFAVDGQGEMLTRLRARGAELIGQMQYGDAYRLAYIRGPEGIIVYSARPLLLSVSSGCPAGCRAMMFRALNSESNSSSNPAAAIPP